MICLHRNRINQLQISKRNLQLKSKSRLKILKRRIKELILKHIRKMGRQLSQLLYQNNSLVRTTSLKRIQQEASAVSKFILVFLKLQFHSHKSKQTKLN